MKRHLYIPVKKACILIAFILIFPFITSSAWGAESDDDHNSLTLQHAYQMALKQNEQIAASAQRLRQAQADLDIATSPLLPQIEIMAETVTQKEHMEIPDNYNDIRISGVQSLYQGGKNWHNRSAAKQTAESEGLRHFRLKQEVLYTVAYRFHLVLLSRQSIDISENQKIRAEIQFDRANQLLELGMVNETAVLRAKVQVAVAEENLERAKNQFRITMEQLSLELGIENAPLSVKEPEERTFGNDPPDTYIHNALKFRADVQQAQLLVKAAEYAVKAEKSDFIPDFSVRGSYVLGDTDELYYGDKDHWEVALTASYPLYSGNRDVSELLKSKAFLAESKSMLNRLKQEVRVTVRSVYFDIHTQQKVIKNIKDQVSAASANYQQVTAQFEEGLVSSVDLVDAQTVLNEAESQLAKSYYRLQIDQLRMDRAVGTLEMDILNKK
jgi:outer membrane protein